MPIKPLPATSVRALGSGQALTDSLALVKELIENSLDAFATQITVEVSQNVLDVIQVKDNGHGIPEEDRDAVALRYCTSKIREFGDIQGCRSLGFRGEALASAAELAGGLVITTRVGGEKTASACTIDRGGAVVGRKAVSAQVGTTVRVEGFFKHLPVRRENALKGATKSLSRLRTLIQRYYLSHPRCRFSLRVLPSPQRGGAKGRSDDTVYAPSKTVQEAVQKAVGKDVAATCEWIDTSSSEYAEVLAKGGTEDEGENDEEESVVLEAFLPKPSTNPATISKKPQCTNFTFVDSRSVSCSRGTLKQIHTLYKSYLKSAISAPGISDPFIYLNIRCPLGSYDPNIEPAKDDVMFQDADTVVKVVESMLKRFYGELKGGDKPDKGKAKETLNGFELLLARKPKSPVSAAAPKTPSASTLPNVRPPEISDYDVDEEEEELAARETDAVVGTCGFVATNSLQRKNALSLPPMVDLGENQLMEGVEEAEKTAGPSDGVSPTADIDSAPGQTTILMTTPRRKSTWGFNMSDLIEDGDGEDDEPMEQHASDNEESARKDITISNPWTTAKLNTPIHSSPAKSSPLPQRQMGRPFKPPSIVRQSNSSPSSPENTRTTRSGRASALMTPGPSSPPTSSNIFRENREAGVRRVRQINMEAGGDEGIMNSWISKTQRRGDDANGEGGDPPALSGFISAAKVYKDRVIVGDDEELYQQQVNKHTKRTKQAPAEALKRRRLNNGHQDKGFTAINRNSHGDDDDLEPAPGPSKSSPHRNRFLAATAALNQPASRSEESPREVLTVDDDTPPLPPPIEKTRPKRRRTKTLLPLDIVPDVPLQTHMLRKPVDIVTSGRLRGMFRGLRESDAYVGGSAAGMGGGEDEGEKEDEGMFFCESRDWDDAGAVGEALKRWILGIAEKDGREGLVESVVGVGWEWRSGEEGDRDEKVLCAIGMEFE